MTHRIHASKENELYLQIIYSTEWLLTEKYCYFPLESSFAKTVWYNPETKPFSYLEVNMLKSQAFPDTELTGSGVSLRQQQ